MKWWRWAALYFISNCEYDILITNCWHFRKSRRHRQGTQLNQSTFLSRKFSFSRRPNLIAIKAKWLILHVSHRTHAHEDEDNPSSDKLQIDLWYSDIVLHKHKVPHARTHSRCGFEDSNMNIWMYERMSTARKRTRTWNESKNVKPGHILVPAF